MHDDISETLMELLQRQDYIPVDAPVMARQIGLGPGRMGELRELLRDWEREGIVVKLQKGRYALRRVLNDTLRGRLHKVGRDRLIFTADSEGQEKLEKLVDEDTPRPITIPVHSRCTLGAMHGDLVLAGIRRAVPREYNRRGHKFTPREKDLRLEARVKEILERRAGAWVGIYRAEGSRFGKLTGDGKTCPAEVKICEAVPEGLLSGMCVAVEPVRYPLANMPATGKVTEVLGWPEDSGTDITIILHRYGLRDSFPDEVLQQSAAIPDRVSAAELSNRDDWRDRCVITIDPATARDFDDAISVQKHKDGWELAVHIADVSHYVRPGTALDEEARQRGNSTYLPDRVLPMLPPRLCDGICSLREGEDRLTMLCHMKINRSGKIFRSDFRRAVIRSRKRLSYEQALEIIEGRGSSEAPEVDAMLAEAHKLAQLLRRKRFAAGALNLELPELHTVLDDHGEPIGVSVEKGDEAHWLIEEFMLAANESVARALKEKQVPAIYRVHESPDPAKLQEFSQTLHSYGLRVGLLSTQQQLADAIDKIRGHRDEQLLLTAMLRAMMRACYSPKPLGHYGLAKEDYCHFTSPIRRYADLVIHRSLERLFPPEQRVGATLPPPAQLAVISEHLSETERISATAEQEAERAKLVRFLRLQCESESPIVWQAFVTATWEQGLAIDIPQLQLQGTISAGDLPDTERWFYERHASRWTSTAAHTISPGSQLTVVPVEVDSITGFVHFRPISI